MKLFMVMLGATPPGRFTEQHDIFFGIGQTLAELLPAMQAFWPEAQGRIHIDAWREVTAVDSFRIDVVEKSPSQGSSLFFLNLGGYKPGEFEEYHYKLLTVADSLATATKKAKATAFYKHCGFKGAVSHVDDKYGIDVDEAHRVEDILAMQFREKYTLNMTPVLGLPDDVLHIGYVKIDKLKGL